MMSRFLGKDEPLEVVLDRETAAAMAGNGAGVLVERA